MRGGDVAGAVAGAVVDDQHLGADAADLGRHLVEHVADVLGLVVGGDEDRDLAAEALRQSRLAELLPGQPLQRRRELARVARRHRERPQDQEEEDEDGEDGEAEDAAAVALFEGEGGEQAVDDFGPRDQRQAEAGGEQEQHVDVAQGAPAEDRVGDQADREDQPAAAERRQFGGEDACSGDHSRPEDMAAAPRDSARAASGKTSVISTSLRRGAASEAAPIAVTRTIGVASAISSHQRRPSPSSDEAGQAERDEQDLDGPPDAAAHRCADAAAPHAADLARGHRQRSRAGLRRSTWRSSACRSCRGRSRAAGRGSGFGDAVEQRRRVDRVQRCRVRRQVAVPVALRPAAP